ncbi:MAG: hypothetical protein RIT14_663 [Pseudomonadota bacterium]
MGADMTDTFHHDYSSSQDVRFTYSHPGQSTFRKTLIRGVERLSGQPHLRKLYLDWSAAPGPNETVFAAALRLLRINLLLRDTRHLDALPRDGGLLIIANHPYGIVDGLALGHLGMTLRGNVRIMTNSLLCQPREVLPHLLPVDFSGTVEARKTTAETRRRAADLLSDGKVVAIFPGGGVATANRPLRGAAVDSDWHPFVGRLATLPGVTTLPLHFSGQNSRLFQIASHLSYPLRVALIFHETRRLMGQPIEVTLGAPIASDTLSQLDRTEIARHLRRLTMALDPRPSDDPDEVFTWPSHIRFN